MISCIQQLSSRDDHLHQVFGVIRIYIGRLAIVSARLTASHSLLMSWFFFFFFFFQGNKELSEHPVLCVSTKARYSYQEAGEEIEVHYSYSLYQLVFQSASRRKKKNNESHVKKLRFTTPQEQIFSN